MSAAFANRTAAIRPLHMVTVRLPDTSDRPGLWISTSGQDRTVLALLGAHGFFIELGANAPAYGSNTRSLERDHHWRGLCIEANPRLHVSLLGNRRCEVVAAAVSDEERDMRVMESGPGSHLYTPTSGLMTSAAVRTIPFSRLLAHFCVPRVIDYLSLDVEGHEESVMRTFPFDRHQISLLTVERPSAALQATLRAQQCHYACNHGNELWLHASKSVELRRAQRRALTCHLPGGGHLVRCESIADPSWQCAGGVVSSVHRLTTRLRSGLAVCGCRREDQYMILLACRAFTLTT